MQKVSRGLGGAERPSHPPGAAARKARSGPSDLEDKPRGHGAGCSLLHLAQFHADDQLRLGRHVLEYISLEPP